MLKKVLLTIPYRDSYFLKKYGYAVRDTQIIYSLVKLEYFDKVIVLNRPVSIYERILNKQFKAYWDKLFTIDTTSYDLIGPLKRREWTVQCYKNIFNKLIDNLINDGIEELVILDFTPISIIPIINSSNIKITYWYDMIDNFLKHNRYTSRDKEFVKSKYTYVQQNYNLVTGVSLSALNSIEHNNSHILSNGVFGIVEKFDLIRQSEVEYHFGFIGFVTNKLDVEFIKKILHLKYKIIIYGKVLDKSVQKELEKYGAKFIGAFTYSQIPQIMNTFKIGLLPYIKEKEHDGSPLKLYEYLLYNKPCFTSINYEIQNEFVLNYNELEDHLETKIEYLLNQSSLSHISETISKEDYLFYKLNNVFWKVFN